MEALLTMALRSADPLPADLLTELHTQAAQRNDTRQMTLLRSRRDLPDELRPPRASHGSWTAVVTDIEEGNLDEDALLEIADTDTRINVLRSLAANALSAEVARRLAGRDLPEVAFELGRHTTLERDIHETVVDTLCRYINDDPAGKRPPRRKVLDWLGDARQARVLLTSDHVPLGLLTDRKRVQHYSRNVDDYRRLCELLAAGLLRRDDPTQPGAGKAALGELGRSVVCDRPEAVRAAETVVNGLEARGSIEGRVASLAELLEFRDAHGPIGHVLRSAPLDVVEQLEQLLDGTGFHHHDLRYEVAYNPHVPDDRMHSAEGSPLFPRLLLTPESTEKLLAAGRTRLVEKLLAGPGGYVPNVIATLAKHHEQLSPRFVRETLPDLIAEVATPDPVDTDMRRLARVEVVTLAARYELIGLVPIGLLRQVTVEVPNARRGPAHYRAANAVATALGGYYRDPARRVLLEQLAASHDGTLGELLAVVDELSS